MNPPQVRYEVGEMPYIEALGSLTRAFAKDAGSVNL
ncbi:hypothetical protein EMIT0357P_30089 [Pseudomonas marginalis]